MARPYKRRDSRFWWFAPWINGKQIPQSSGETDYDRADRKLKILEGKLAANAPIKARTDRDSFAALLEAVKVDYGIHGRRSLKDMSLWIKNHLEPYFGHWPTRRITSTEINEYVLSRQQYGAANGTINRELTIVKRAFRLGLRSGAVSVVPHIALLPEAPPRMGFFTEEGFRSVLRHTTSQDVRDILVCCYYTGWRIESVIALEWRNVDFARGLIGLRKEQTKNRKATAFPLAPFPELRAMLETRHDLTRQIEREKACVIPGVFHRQGKPVINIKSAWYAAREKAGLPSRILHDFRRTAVRNLKRDGWSDTDIMTMVGLKTLSMLLRYNITTEDDILRKGEEIAKRAQRKA